MVERMDVGGSGTRNVKSYVTGRGVVVETSWPLKRVDELRRLGPRGVPALLKLTYRGDWCVRAMALSAVGVIVREDTLAWRRRTIRHFIGRRVAWFRDAFGVTGPRGAFVSGPVANRLQDNSWIVRLAAAFALGEFRDADRIDDLRTVLKDPLRPVRIAAAAALGRCGEKIAALPERILDGSDPAPMWIGDATPARQWLERLAGIHLPVLEGWGDIDRDRHPETPADWARLLAGENAHLEQIDSRAAEIERYVHDKEAHYNLTKPFTSVNRAQNIQLLNSFTALAGNLQLPLGGLILDMGAGTAWVSELLARLGYRTVTLDIAETMLRIGQRRFEQAQLPFHPIAGDMTRLPVAGHSLDAVLIIDALHHAPDLQAVFDEVFRVLADGGQFLIAEPGEGHAETTKSRGESQEHGVREAEIHLFEAARYARAAGFDSVRILLHYFPEIAMTPEDFECDMMTSTEKWRVLKGERLIAFDEFVVQSVLGHPMMIMSKGRRQVDSYAPHILKAEITPDLFRDGGRVYGTVTAANAGDTLWICGTGGVGTVRLGIQLLTPERRLIDMDYARIDLPRNVRPGEAIQLAVGIDLPHPQTGYVIKLDLVDEQVCWFGDVGSQPVHVGV